MGDDDEDVFYDPIDEELLARRRSRFNRLSGAELDHQQYFHHVSGIRRKLEELALQQQRQTVADLDTLKPLSATMSSQRALIDDHLDALVRSSEERQNLEGEGKQFASQRRLKSKSTGHLENTFAATGSERSTIERDEGSASGQIIDIESAESRHQGTDSEKTGSIHTLISGSKLGVDSVGTRATLMGTLDLSAQSRAQRVKVKLKHRSQTEFANLFLIQQLLTTPMPSTRNQSGAEGRVDTALVGLEQKDMPAIYSLKFSPDGTFLAAGSGDGVVRVWKLICAEILGQLEVDANYRPSRKMAAIFAPEPSQYLVGHEGEVVDLCWSSNNFLLSASTDCNVRLWHPSKPECLAVFPHKDIVTSVAFHPKDDRIFISGSFDCRIRLWSVQEKKVRAWNELPKDNYVSAVAFTNNGRFALAGSSTGVLLMFEYQGFKYHTQILVRPTSGKSNKGQKIASISAKPGKEEETVLVASNDSRIRTYSLRDKTLTCKYKGHLNETSQIQATFSDDSEYIITGGEDGRCVIWPVEGRHRSGHIFSGIHKDRNDSCEHFQAYSLPCTAAIFAPSALNGQLLSCHLRPAPVEGESLGFADGHIIATADIQGKVRLFENNSKLEKWLKEQD